MRTKIIRPAAAALFLLSFVLLTLWVNRYDKTELVTRSGQTFEKAIVREVLTDNLQADGSRVGQQTILAELLSGVKKRQIVEATSSSGYLFGAACTPGMRIILMQSVAGDTVVASVYSQDREWVIYLFAALYLLLLCAIGGKQGLKGSIGLVFTFICIIFVYIPLIYRGYSPFWSAVFVCFITTFATMYLIGGLSRKTFCAIGGTITGVLCAGITAILFGTASGISGYNVSNIESLMTLWNTNGIQVGGLLLSGLLISTLGATMDVAMSISSAMAEIAAQNRSLSRKELWLAGLRVGRDMMGTDSNTLILAFAGTSVSTLLLDYAYNLPYCQIINSNNIGIAIMQGLSGSFGIVLSVPLTVTLGALAFRPHKIQQEGF